MIVGRDDYEKQSQELRLSPAVSASALSSAASTSDSSTNRPGLPDRESRAELVGCTGWQDTWWLTQQQRVDRDWAAFGEATFDISSSWSLTAGLRHYKYDNSLEGFRGYGLDVRWVCKAGPDRLASATSAARSTARPA